MLMLSTFHFICGMTAGTVFGFLICPHRQVPLIFIAQISLLGIFIFCLFKVSLYY